MHFLLTTLKRTQSRTVDAILCRISRDWRVGTEDNAETGQFRSCAFVERQWLPDIGVSTLATVARSFFIRFD